MSASEFTKVKEELKIMSASEFTKVKEELKKINKVEKLFRIFEREISIYLNSKALESEPEQILLKGVFETAYGKLKEKIGEYDDEIIKQELFEIMFFNNDEILNQMDEVNLKSLAMKFNEYVGEGYILAKKNEQPNIISWYIKENKENKEIKYANYKKIENSIIDAVEIELFTGTYLYFRPFREDDHASKQRWKIMVKIANKFYSEFIKKVNFKKEEFDFKIDIDCYEKEIDKGEWTKNKKIILTGDKKEINILHLSDLHLTEENNDDSNSNKVYERFLNAYYDENTSLYEISNGQSQEKKFTSNIDIIVITGDIIQAGSSSEEMIKRYLCALKQINIIAMDLLKNNWQERLIIIPGNHDYGIINELEIKLAGRKVESTKLSNKNLSEQVKFIFFHMIFKDIIIDINNIDKSPKLHCSNYTIGKNKLKFYKFNTAALANSIITNKVGINYEFEYHKADYNPNEKVFFLMHHTPIFEINYYRDANMPEKLYSNDEFMKDNYMLGINKESIENILKSLNEGSKLETRDDKDIDKIVSEIINEEKEAESLASQIKDLNRELSNAITYSRLLRENNEEIENDDWKIKKYEEIISQIIMSKMHQTAYNTNVEKIIDKFGSNHPIILGGHYHQQRICFDYNNTGTIVVEAGQFEKEHNNEFNYWVINVDLENNNSTEFYSSIPEKDLKKIILKK